MLPPLLIPPYSAPAPATPPGGPPIPPNSIPIFMRRAPHKEKKGKDVSRFLCPPLYIVASAPPPPVRASLLLPWPPVYAYSKDE